ncbi:MAG: DNA internalization-related competence protein ComEC/Rec2 [Fastidiosipila sp.]|nr:DNA internalization-related competence protein ComEC/Rec2 [Fastidiosipila sp.]
MMRLVAMRPGALCFVLLFSFSFFSCRLRIARWERRVPEGAINFTGLVVEAGNPLPGDPHGVRAQKIRLADGTPVLIRTDLPAQKGDRIEGRAVFECAEGARNPGGFSERNWLWSRGAVWIGRSGSFRLDPRQGFFLWFARLPDRIRDFVRQHHLPLWESRCGPLILSLVTGDTRLLQDRQTFFLRSSGLSHLTSVSGTHLILLLGPLMWLARKSRLPLKARQWAILPLILLPGILSGWKSGISRASLVLFASKLDFFTRLRRDGFNLLLLIGSILLAAKPYAIFDQSFWMSLSAAGAVFHTAKRLSGRSGSPVYTKLRAAMVFSAAAQGVILPYQITTAPGIHLLSPFLNMAALPLAAYLMAASYPALFVLSFLPRSSELFAPTTRAIAALLNPAADLLMWMSEAVAKTHAAFIPLKWCLLFLPLIAFWAWFFAKKKRKLPPAAALAASSLGWLLVVCLAIFSTPAAKVIFFDVGQGDATLFITESGQTLIIDGGDKNHGYRTIIPAARMQALGKIDLAIVTHAHNDHAWGIAELMDAGLIGHLCLPAVEADSQTGPLHEEDMTALLLEMAKESNLPVTLLQAGDSIRLGKSLIEVLHPDSRSGRVDLNEASLVMRVTMGGLSLLMTGDLTEEGERAILRSRVDCSADLLHVAHHGSRHSSSADFLEASNPKTALISSGRNNRYGHPHLHVLDRLDQRAVRILRTDESGAVFLKIRGGKGRITTWLPCAGRTE